MLQEQRSSVCINDFMGILHPWEQNFHPAKCSTIFNRLNIWEHPRGANWANLKTLPRVYWHVQNEPGACSGSKTPPVYRPLNKVHINSKTNKETGSNCFKTIVLRIFLGWENLVEFLCTTASLKLKLQYNIPLHPTAKNPGQRYHLSHYHCKSVNKSIKNQQRYVPNTQSTGLVLRVQ